MFAWLIFILYSHVCSFFVQLLAYQSGAWSAFVLCVAGSLNCLKCWNCFVVLSSVRQLAYGFLSIDFISEYLVWKCYGKFLGASSGFHPKGVMLTERLLYQESFFLHFFSTKSALINKNIKIGFPEKKNEVNRFNGSYPVNCMILNLFWVYIFFGWRAANIKERIRNQRCANIA